MQEQTEQELTSRGLNSHSQVKQEMRQAFPRFAFLTLLIIKNCQLPSTSLFWGGQEVPWRAKSLTPPAPQSCAGHRNILFPDKMAKFPRLTPANKKYSIVVAERGLSSHGNFFEGHPKHALGHAQNHQKSQN